MAGALRVFSKELFEFLEGFRGIVMVLVLPALLLLMVGQLRNHSPHYRLLVAGTPAEKDLPAQAKFTETIHLLREISVLEVTTRDAPVLDPLLVMDSGQYDLVLNISGEGKGQWLWFTGETNPSRLSLLQQLVTGLQRALDVMDHRVDAKEVKEDFDKTEFNRLTQDLGAMGTFPTSSLFIYYPSTLEKSLSLLPRTIALILCFLPFVLTASSIIRERESHTIEMLLAAPGMSRISLFIGKCILPIAVILFDFLLMLVLTESVYHIHIKPGLTDIVIFVIPALFVSTFLGIAVSSTVRSQSQVITASAVCFLALTLLSGFLFPVAESSQTLLFLSKLSPLTFVQPVLDAWMFGAIRIPYRSRAISWLLVQCAFYGTLALVAFYRRLRYV
jgi:ABC-type multidrug transport system permease subunit